MKNATTTESYFTASQLALALATSRTRAHQVMVRATKASVILSVKGQSTKHWPLAAIPQDVQTALRRKAEKGKYCSWTHLLFDAPQPWEPKIPLAKLARSGVEKAELRRSVLAPILTGTDALVVPVSELVRRAQAMFRAMIEVRLPQDLAVRQWIEQAIERDRGLGQWQRLEIYLDENAPVQTVAAKVAAVVSEAGGDPLARALVAVAQPAAPTDAERSHVCNVLFHRFTAMVGQGASEAKAKRALLRQITAAGLPLLAGTPAARSMAWKRLFKKWREGGQSADAFVDGRTFCPKRPALYVPNERETAALKKLNLKTGSAAMAVHLFADSAACSPELREVIRRPRKSKHNLPVALRRAASVTPEAEAHERGGRDYQYSSFTSMRGDFEIMPDGSKRAIEAGDWWELDDMSWNQPFWFESMDADDALAQKHGACMARQCLLCADVKSGKWLGAEFIGRSRDSYRAEDILRFFRSLFAEYGLPRRGVRLERGIWKSRIINGQKIPGLSKEDEEAVFGGLRKLGIEVRHCFTAKQKGHIESGFGFLQKAAAAIVEGPNVGRWRGERARDSKQVQRVRDGIVHPRTIGMLHVDQHSEQARAAMVWCNGQAKEGRIQRGVPDEVWVQSIKRDSLRPLQPDTLYLLLPEQRALKVRAGHVWPKVAGVDLQFSAPALFAELGTDYPVMVCFDPTEPTLGAWIFNAATGSMNRDSYAKGQYLGHAEHCPLAPQFAPAGYVDENIERRRKYHRAFRTKYVSTGIFGHRTATRSELRDGKGNVARIERGAAPTVSPAEPAGRRRRSASGEGDSLVEKAKAMQAAKTPKATGPSLEEINLQNQIGRLEMADSGKVSPYFLTPEEKARLESLRTALRARMRGRGVVDPEDVKRRRIEAQHKLGIYKP